MTFDVRVVQNPNKATSIGTSLRQEMLRGGYLFTDDVQIPVNVPINVCGNSVGIIGQLNPALGNSCVKA